MKKNRKIKQTLAAVHTHTHTHTHTDNLFQKDKLIVINIIIIMLIIIVISIVVIERVKLNERKNNKVISETRALEDLSSKWDLNLVSTVTSADGIIVPVPNG